MPAPKRNFLIYLPEEKKKALKFLAKKSGMTMEAYAGAILDDAIKHQDAFMFVKSPRREPALTA